MSADPHDDLLSLEAELPTPGARVGGLFEEERQRPGPHETEEQEVESEHCGAAEEDPYLLFPCRVIGVDGRGCYVAEQGLEEDPVYGEGDGDAP